MNLFKLIWICCLPVLYLSDIIQINGIPLALKIETTEWLINDLVVAKGGAIRITGNPVIRDAKYGKVVLFNGTTDGIFLDQMPLVGMEQFTIETIIRPDSGGKFEQRFFHCGEIRGSRVLFETRSTPTHWYFDAFNKSGEQQKTLIDSTLLLPQLNQKLPKLASQSE